MKIVDKICVEDNVEIVTIDKLPNEKDTIANVFCIIAQQKINVDMISYLGGCRGEIRVSFSTNKDDIDALIKAMKRVKSLYNCAVTNIYGANAKIVLSGNIKGEIGIASRVFECLSRNGIEIRLMTTGENEILLVVGEGDADLAYEELLKEME